MFSLTPSHIIEYLYCPRFTWFEYVLRIPQYEEKHYKVMQGRNMHETKAVQNKEYLRKKIGVRDKRLNVYLTNGLLRGKWTRCYGSTTVLLRLWTTSLRNGKESCMKLTGHKWPVMPG